MRKKKELSFAEKYGRDAIRKLPERKCAVCGKMFTPPDFYPLKKVCSQECSEELIRRLKKGEKWDGRIEGDEHWREKIRNCAICGKEFKPVRQRQVCCSHNCNCTLQYRKMKARAGEHRAEGLGLKDEGLGLKDEG